jgi:hypothetical protein
MQRLKSDTLRLQHRFFRDPVAEKSRHTLLLGQLHDQGMFGGSKVTLRKFFNLYTRANSFKINSDLLPHCDRNECTALRMGHIERDRGLIPRFPRYERFAYFIATQFDDTRADSEIPTQHRSEPSMRKHIALPILLPNQARGPMLFFFV